MASGVTDNRKLSFDLRDRKTPLNKQIVYRRKNVINNSQKLAREGAKGDDTTKDGVQGNDKEKFVNAKESEAKHTEASTVKNVKDISFLASWIEFVSNVVTQGHSFAYWLREEISSIVASVVFKVVDWVTSFTESSPTFDFLVQIGISFVKYSTELSKYLKGLPKHRLLCLPILFLIAFPLVLLILSTTLFMFGFSSISMAILTAFSLFLFLVFSIVLVPFVLTTVIVVGSVMMVTSLFSKQNGSFYKELFIQENSQFKKRLRNIADTFPKPFINDGKETLKPNIVLPDHIKDTSLAKMFIGEDTATRHVDGYNVVPRHQGGSQDLNDIIKREDPIKLSLVADDAPESSTTNSGFESSIIRAYAIDSNNSGDGHAQT